ncbi:hypothetical protein [Paenibacillus hamazuiensis]|uniref:hypothetical protein n=1 Tax=Paenibacillus hamazuiensis TaxID=2936508 RepID=UPI00200FBA84|nr:hypothetical protein [Paenibacillus hamazuiensis]
MFNLIPFISPIDAKKVATSQNDKRTLPVKAVKSNKKLKTKAALKNSSGKA